MTNYRKGPQRTTNLSLLPSVAVRCLCRKIIHHIVYDMPRDSACVYAEVQFPLLVDMNWGGGFCARPHIYTIRQLFT